MLFSGIHEPQKSIDLVYKKPCLAKKGKFAFYYSTQQSGLR